MAIRLIKNSNGSTVLRTTDDEVTKCSELVFKTLVDTKGDTVVVRAGQRPFLITSNEQVLLARQPLTNTAVTSLLDHLLPTSLRGRLDREGAVHYSRPVDADLKGEQFVVDVAKHRDGWSIEIGRAAVVRNTEIDEIAEIWGTLGSPCRLSPPVGDDLALPSEDELWPSEAAPRTARRA